MPKKVRRECWNPRIGIARSCEPPNVGTDPKFSARAIGAPNY